MSINQKHNSQWIDTIYTVLAIALCLLGGYGVYNLIQGLPASLYGMLIFTVALKLRLVSAERVAISIQWFLKNMAVFFIPAGVGLIQHLGLMQQYGVELIILTCLTTIALLLFVGRLMQRRFDLKNTKEIIK